jgi:hypothetical protein
MAMRLIKHTIERALAGANAVIQTLGVSPTPELIFGGTRLFSVATRVLVNAMESSAVRRLICITGFGAGWGISLQRCSLPDS